MTPDTLKINDLLENSWGCTMQQWDFYQVVAIKNKKVWLSHPVVESEGNQEGYTWVAGVRTFDKPIEEHNLYRAKWVRGKLRLCERDFKIKGRWDDLNTAIIGKKRHFYGD